MAPTFTGLRVCDNGTVETPSDRFGTISEHASKQPENDILMQLPDLVARCNSISKFVILQSR